MATAALSSLEGRQPEGGSCPLVTKLDRFVRLSLEDIAALEGLCGDQQTLGTQHLLTVEGDRKAVVYLIVSGLAVRRKIVSPRRRQILGYLAAGDLSAPYCADTVQPPYEILLLSKCRVATIPVQAVVELTRRHPQIERGLLLVAAAEMAILREWLLNIGQRGAYDKLSHFFCEMTVRLEAVGLGNADGSVDLPLSQSCIADTTGLTHIHVNRVLKRLRAKGLIALNKRLLTVPDPGRLLASVEFEGSYLEPPALRD